MSRVCHSYTTCHQASPYLVKDCLGLWNVVIILAIINFFAIYERATPDQTDFGQAAAVMV